MSERMDERGRNYLEAMGIQVWQLRRPPAQSPLSLNLAGLTPVEASTAESVESTVPAESAASVEMPTVESVESTAEPVAPVETPAAAPETPTSAEPSATPAEASFESTAAPPVAAPPPAAADIPPEYADWALQAEADPEPDIFELSSATPVDERAERIAGLDWEALQTEVSGCTACTLHSGRTQAVFGVGDRQAQWLIIGEAPGADEDRLGEPFVGRAGKLLDAMLFALNLSRANNVYIANILKCRPPQNRDPLPAEARSCRPFLQRQITLIRPKIILAVGRVAAQNLLQTDTPIGKLRNRVHRLEDFDIPVIVTYHPAYLLRSPREKRKVWDDLQLARQLARRTLAAAGDAL